MSRKVVSLGPHEQSVLHVNRGRAKLFSAKRIEQALNSVIGQFGLHSASGMDVANQGSSIWVRGSPMRCFIS
ncbi:hypothetical protein [Mesorhizobium sp. M1216]|uniref:hypothetical protein n=1 Tax=Mesorhizobium sp. M1216 TaxID=2957069 RepID=UPI00333B99DE